MFAEFVHELLVDKVLEVFDSSVVLVSDGLASEGPDSLINFAIEVRLSAAIHNRVILVVSVQHIVIETFGEPSIVRFWRKLHVRVKVFFWEMFESSV